MNIGIILAGGVGSRMGLAIPKQFYEFNEKPLILYALEAFQKSSYITNILVVCLKGWEATLIKIIEDNNINKFTWITNGGNTYQESLTNALLFLEKICNNGDDIVIIHNGNRPMVTEDLIEDSVVTCKKYGNGVCAIPCVDTVMYSDNYKNSMQYLERDKVFITQTPRTYYFAEILEVYKKALDEGLTNKYEDDLMTRYGKKTFFAKGSKKNIKITTQEDLFYLNYLD